MRKISFLLFLSAALSSCIKDNCAEYRSYSFYQPVYKTTSEIRANIKSNAPQKIEIPGKIYLKDNYLFLGESGRGVHIINNANPASPKKVAFIDIPGCMDMAVKGNTLYADLYTDLVVVDITDPLDAKLQKVVENVFPYQYYAMGVYNDSSRVIFSWTRRDTTVREDCDAGRGMVFMDAAGVYALNSGTKVSSTPSPVGISGSMARFTLMNNRLYTVGHDDLQVFNVTEEKNPVFASKTSLGWGIETIYPFKTNLFIGSQSGMFIYNVNNPDAPQKVGEFQHVSSCDPVIADDDYAYVTLRSGTQCLGFTNQLDVVKLNNLINNTLIKTYPMTNPHGLSKEGDLLFICDGADGLKLYNSANVSDLKLISHLKGINTYDVIAWNKVAMVVAADGLYQYDYSNPASLKLLSKINIDL